MLVLRRKRHERIQVGDTTLTVLEIHRGYVVLGFDGPKEVRRLPPWKPVDVLDELITQAEEPK